MDDRFLHDLRREPSSELAERLRGVLRETEAQAPPAAWARAGRWAGLAASLALVAAAFTVPAVRAGAQAFLDLFRVANFVGVAFDPQRLAQLRDSGLDLPRLLGDQVQVVQAAGAPIAYAELQAAAAAAGMDLETPAWTPAGLMRTRIEAAGAKAFRVTVDTARLKTVLDALAIDDIALPAGLDGRSAEVRVPPVVRMVYANGSQQVQFVQARAPEVRFPAGVDLATLAEIGLRVLGLGRNDAYRFAQNVDWRSTLIVPVPAPAASFRQIDVAGHAGLLLEYPRPRAGAAKTAMILWSAADRVYAMVGNLRETALLEMAETVQ